MPFRILAWQWIRNDTTHRGDTTTFNWYCTQTSFTCANLPIREAGVMRFKAIVNAIPDSDSVRVECADPDSLLPMAVRDGLMRALDSSKYWDPNLSHRSESTFSIDQQVAPPNQRTFDQFPMNPTPTGVCEGSIDRPAPDYYTSVGIRPVAFGHAHASEPNVPVICMINGQSSLAKTAHGAGSRDWAAMDSINATPQYVSAGWTPLSHIIVDPHETFIMRPGGQPGDELKPGNVFRHDVGKCAWRHPPVH